MIFSSEVLSPEEIVYSIMKQSSYYIELAILQQGVCLLKFKGFFQGLYRVILSHAGPVYLLDGQPTRLSPKESNTRRPY